MSRYTFDFSKLSLLHIADLEEAVERNSLRSLLRALRPLACFDIARCHPRELPAILAAFAAAAENYAIPGDPAAEATARRLLGQALGEE